MLEKVGLDRVNEFCACGRGGVGSILCRICGGV